MCAELLFKDHPRHALYEVSASQDVEFSRQLQATFAKYARPFAAGSPVLIEGDACKTVFCLLEGWMHLSKSLENGQTQIIEFVLPGDIVDATSADGITASGTIETLTCGRLAAVPLPIWHRMIHDWPQLQRLTQRMEAAKQARLAERMLRLGKGTAEMRVAYAMMEFLIRIDPASDLKTPKFKIPLTQQQLGDYIGLSSVHVCRTLRRMVRNGILDVKDHMEVRIFDTAALAGLSGMDISTLRRDILPSWR